MSEFKAFKKADLAKVARKVGISVRSKDTKQLLLEKIESFIDEQPERAKELIESAGLEDEVATLIEDDDDEDEEEVSVAVEVEEEDKDYNAPAPLSFQEWVVDPAIDVFEQARAKVLDFTDSIGLTTLDVNDDLRESLSRVVALNYLEVVAEAAFFLYTNVPIVPVKHNNLIHQVFRDNIPRLQTSSWPSPDFSALLEFSVLSVFGNWVIYAVLLPLLISFYVNFSRRVVVISDEDDEEEDISFVVRLYKYDPFIFALAKVLVYYFVLQHGALSSLDSYTNIFHFLKNHAIIQLGLYHQFVTGLGNFPIVIGLANVAIGLYSQFEDF
ncbi:hypothetical protein C7M61_001980 [Candidozyma pseudohaemuli]|uniref:SAP domain-containing protein n=1 Tax=Candidozyma pseudohaemuli TaxID=418784 RepID=A0A2P7YTV1_9ASCO|nr:hypothetical protein C7M61_001980 [[Candida] pseudohaemulonii]PSK39369.1 hypothetical protein C7M61_001980 [[Candida] pseudohaemulonii]